MTKLEEGCLAFLLILGGWYFFTSNVSIESLKTLRDDIEQVQIRIKQGQVTRAARIRELECQLKEYHHEAC
jgi:hypothetical protein